MENNVVYPSSFEMTSMQLTLDKEIRVNKDVNGVAITDDNTVLLALGSGTSGGLATLNIYTGKLEVSQQGRCFRQIITDSAGNIHTSTQDTIHTYAANNLEAPLEVTTPGPKVWGICLTPDNQMIYTDIKKKKVWKLSEQGNRMIVRKTEENSLRSVWSVACGTDRLYITDRKKRQVICTQLDGTYLWRRKLGRPFPKYRKAVEDMAYNYIGGMCMDSEGENLLVCDTVNNLLTEITPEGEVLPYNNLDLDKPAHVAVNSGYVVVATQCTLLDCIVKVFRRTTTL